MRENIWQAVARFCAHPAVTNFLIRQAMRRPYMHIGDYMCRYWLIPPAWRLPFSVRVHFIRRPDADPYLHDHPWNWRTIVLQGWYVEEDVFGTKAMRQSGETKGATAETLHRIHLVPHNGVWTLFIMGRRRNRWGFMLGNKPRKVYYRDYVSINDRGEVAP